MPLRTWIKMCGITRADDAQAAAAAGADALGFVMTPSPRRVTPAEARKIIRTLPPHVLRLGVFVDERAAEIAEAALVAEVDRVQVHHPADPVLRDLLGARLLVAFRARDEGVPETIRESGEETFLVDAYSPDAPGGTGRVFDWSIARHAAEHGSLILAGGLTPENVGRAIREVRPFGVDVSTGIEDAPGIKNVGLMEAFVRAVREADAALGADAAAAK
ncbi:MAG: phosphoribosylanthranilate isomerase [bacterium]